jgi:hypothetical protein
MLVDTKSHLAKLLATENITIEQRKVATASFHIKDRILILPILSEELSSWLYDLFCGHEVGHALYTPEEGWHDSVVDLKIPKSILNVTEDARIEKLIKRKYPGLRTSFTKAYRELMERDFFDIANVDVNKLNFVDRLNLHFKVGSSLGIRFNEIETPIVQEMENLETWEDTVRVSCIILELMKEQNKQNKEQRASEPSDAENEYEETYEEDYDEDPEEVESEENEVESGEAEEDKEDEDGNNSGNGADKDEMDEIKSFTDDSFREREKELLSNETNEPVYADIPELDLKKVIMPYKEVISRLKNEKEHCDNKDFLSNYNGESLDTFYFTDFRRKSNNVVSYLVKEFELRKNAEQMKKASVSKTGDLDMKRIHSYKYSEDLFRRVTNVPNGQSHGIVMFIDWSGSMGPHLNDTVKQLLNLVLFCRKVNVPYEVYAFSNCSNLEKVNPVPNLKNGELVIDSFRLLNVISSKMTTQEFNYVAACLLKMTSTGNSGYVRNYAFPNFMQLSGTPLNEAIIAAMQIVPKFQADNKLQIVNTVFLTDGDGHTIADIYLPNQGQSGTTYNTGTSSLVPWRKIIPVFRHKKTGLFEKAKNMNNTNYTAALIRMLKKVTNTNIVGFYLLSTRDAYSYLNSNFTNVDAINYMRSEFRRNKSIVVKNSGFDEYYLMKADTDVDEIETIEAKSNTTRGLVNAFTKYSNTRVTNRVVLNKFIGMIS